MKIQLIHNGEQYTDQGEFAVMTRITVLKLDSIDDHIFRYTEKLGSNADQPTLHGYQIAETELGLTYRLAPLRIRAKFDN